MILVLLAACHTCDEPIGIEVPSGVATAEYKGADGSTLWTAQASPADGIPGLGLHAERQDADGAVTITLTFSGGEDCDGDELVVGLDYIHDDDGVHDAFATLGGLVSQGSITVESSWFGSGSFVSEMAWEGEGEGCTPSLLRQDGTLEGYWSSDPSDARAYTAECLAL